MKPDFEELEPRDGCGLIGVGLSIGGLAVALAFAWVLATWVLP